jgi:putative phosphoribosyl transferase
LLDKPVQIPLSRSTELLNGVLTIPDNTIGLVIFAHGSGSGASSTRSQLISRAFEEKNLSTLLFDLLTKEEQDADNRTKTIACKVPGVTFIKFNVELLTERLDSVTQWMQCHSETKNLRIAYFGASTGAAAALYAAASLREVKAVVCRGGRTDLVDEKTLEDIRCPILLIVGEKDKKVMEYNKTTLRGLTNANDKKLEIVKGATHLFEEQGKLEQVSEIAIDWFSRYLL